MKTAPEIVEENFKGLNELIKDEDLLLFYKDLIETCMEGYADQFKYDFSQECKCTDSPGSTWCCNLCGLPVTDKNLPK